MINSYFDKIYVINLKKDANKKSKIEEMFKKYNIAFEFYNAEYGYNEPYITKFNKYVTNCRINNTRINIKNAGAWGYLETWKNILTTSINNKYDKILCFDDDVILSNEFNNKFEKTIKQIDNINPNWKIVNLGASQHVWKFIDLTKATSQGYYNAVPYTDGSFAIAINKTVFNELLIELNKFNNPFDSGAVSNIYKKYPKDNYVIYPNIVIADLRSGEINKKDNIELFTKRLKWDLFN